jgi:hypothetical protein
MQTVHFRNSQNYSQRRPASKVHEKSQSPGGETEGPAQTIVRKCYRLRLEKPDTQS